MRYFVCANCKNQYTVKEGQEKAGKLQETRLTQIHNACPMCECEYIEKTLSVKLSLGEMLADAIKQCTPQQLKAED